MASIDPLLVYVLLEEDEDEAVALLMLDDERENRDRPRFRFVFDDIDEESCREKYRFEKTDILRLRDALRLPPRFVGYQGTVCSDIEGLCILLRRLAYPIRLTDMD